ncbi:aminoglycoside phosphotransferase family protein [Micromonospora sp. NPDC049044]|uniref:aminoglycoside phosphotransferase family protein n=1 Tax=unclassified Micromonospora TaxID=2617518 RepID=UPI0033E7DE84
MLKLQYPDDDSRREADALAHWDGDGAIRLLAHDPERRALLVERCRPGSPCTNCRWTWHWTRRSTCSPTWPPLP